MKWCFACLCIKHEISLFKILKNNTRFLTLCNVSSLDIKVASIPEQSQNYFCSLGGLFINSSFFTNWILFLMTIVKRMQNIKKVYKASKKIQVTNKNGRQGW